MSFEHELVLKKCKIYKKALKNCVKRGSKMNLLAKNGNTNLIGRDRDDKK